MNSRLHQIKNWRELAPAVDYNARELAKACCVSLRQLERFFRAAAGKTPQQWLNELRLNRASVLMEKGKTVKEAAHALKYKQQSHFSRAYKRYHGVSPSSTYPVTFSEMSL